MVQQLTLKVSDEDIANLDQLIQAGRFPNRHAFIRIALERLVEQETKALIDEQDIAAYTRIPDGDDPDLDAAIAAYARRSVEEEPW